MSQVHGGKCEYYCKNYLGSDLKCVWGKPNKVGSKTLSIFRCRAYPTGIPIPIVMGEHEHETPYKGDNGIQFEPREGEDE